MHSCTLQGKIEFEINGTLIADYHAYLLGSRGDFERTLLNDERDKLSIDEHKIISKSQPRTSRVRFAIPVIVFCDDVQHVASANCK
jgi:hypothetical protein